MAIVNEKTFLTKLLQTFPEFKEIHEINKEYHDMGIHPIFGDFRRFAEDVIKHNNDEISTRIKDFILGCYTESEDEVKNAIFVSFFENMSDKSLQYFLNNLPADFVDEIKKFLKAFDVATAR